MTLGLPDGEKTRLGVVTPLHMLAFDHRASFTRGLFGIEGTPSSEQRRRIADTKLLILEGLQQAVVSGAPAANAAVLVDEEFGAEVVRSARTEGYMLAMPVERSGQEEFDFEYGDDFGTHIERFDPTFTKVLVRFNPEGPATSNARQLTRLRELSNWLHARGRRFLFELLVPALSVQLGRVQGDTDRYDAELRPMLVVSTIAACHREEVEPDIWKVEGFDERTAYREVVAQARAGGRHSAICIVLGRGESEARVTGWLREAGRVDGFEGFAVGRSIWLDPLRSWLAGDIDRRAAAVEISARYLRMIDAYGAGSVASANR